jgi:hypothetical protein
MAYEPEAALPPEEPDPESGPAVGQLANSPKISQQEAGYRMGSMQRSCGLCANFTGSAGSDPFQCIKVEGTISPYGYSDTYTRQDNPFLAGEQEGFTPSEPAATAAAPTDAQVPAGPLPEEEEPPPGLLQIGSKTYR